MIVSINQPAYLPWLGYFHRIAMSDAHIVLDSVQLEKNSFTNRNKVRTAQGWSWLTVPVNTSGKFGALAIMNVELANDRGWAQKHWATLRLNYGKAPFFQRHAAFFEDVYRRSWLKLHDLAWTITSYLLDAFAIQTPLYFSSQMNAIGKKDELVLNLCREMSATVYLSGPLGKDYLREGLFAEQGVSVRYHDYHHPTYKQVYSGFEPYMSALDLLFNTGPRSREILMTQQEQVSV
jgi:WbqC-like protein family